MFKNSYIRIVVFSALIVSAFAVAGGIKTWANGDTLSATDLNANFQHIHNSMVGGHGGRLLDADVNASANISYSKIQNGRGIARAWGEVSATGVCPAAPTVSESMNVTSVTCAATGAYTVTLGYTATDAEFAVIVSSMQSTTICHGVSTSTTTVAINCVDLDTPAATDSTFSFVIYDAD